ncbi:MAG: glycoside hydrolase family 31 protein [Terracidiphilus sp.]|nr:glycoside hydrolase family 31 protein [Terracidiphilus sp.]
MALSTALVIAFSAPAPATAQMPGQNAPGLGAIAAEQTPRGIRATVGDEVVEVTVCSVSVVHVVAHPASSTPSHPQPWMLDPAESCPGTPFTFARTPKDVSFKTSGLLVSFSLERGNLSFHTAAGEQLLREGDAIPRTYEPVELNGERTFRVKDRFGPSINEAFYGLGQHQSGLFNYRGSTVELAQQNTDVAIPFLVSNKGYALLWNTASLTTVDNRFPLDLTLTSIAGQSIDYYFLYGPDFDRIIHSYRSMTGHAPMLPKWSYGFFQSRDRYVSLDEIRTIANRYREQHIPLDAIVQDWFWWKNEGDPTFNDNYHDVAADLAALHAQNVHTMISIWGLLDPASETYKQMDAKNLLVPNAHVYDATNPEARDLYWKRLPGPLQAMGWDAFWLDSAEPEEYWPHMGDAILSNKQIAIGNGAEYTNVFPLLHTLGVQENWKSATDRKRVFLLTRSAFLGQQRVGATVWSGDVYGNFWGLSHQVPAGLNFALSGYPYWTTDIGGYWPPHDGTLDEPSYHEIYARWFEFGTFCPIFRTHGHRPANELWSMPAIQPTLVQYDKLRYRLMPYIYSLAWRVTNDDYTMQRPLVMDWRTDPRVWSLGDEFMFGPALLVSPVLKPDATHRSVYLPAAPTWYDFWTGTSLTGSREIDAEAPLDRIPLYVRAGSILPLGPEIEYATQSPEGPIELRIYRGADGSFELYEDSGDSYDYQKGEHAVVPIHWSDATGTLTIGARQGSFPGMVPQRTFRIVLVGNNHGAGPAITTKADKELLYKGTKLEVKLR